MPVAPSKAVTAPRPRRRSINVFAGLSHAALAIWAILVVFPIVWTFLASFKTNTELFGDHPLAMPQNFDWSSWGRAWDKAHIGLYMINTVKVVAISTFLTMLFGSMAAYVLARYTFFGNKAVYLLFVSGLSFPVFLALAPLWLTMKNLGLLGTHTGLILVYVAYSLPFTVFFLTAFFRTLPTTVAEAAMVDGCGHFGLFFRVMLPMARPGLISIGLFNVLGHWNQYVLPVVLMNQSDKRVLAQGLASLAISQGYRGDWTALFAGLVIALLPVLIVYVLFQKQVQAGLTAGVLK